MNDCDIKLTITYKDRLIDRSVSISDNIIKGSEYSKLLELYFRETKLQIEELINE